MKTQSVRVCVLVLSYIIASSLVHTPSYATGSVSIVHKGESSHYVTAASSSNGSMTVIEDNLSVITSNDAGYSLYISTDSESNYLASGNGNAILPTSSTTELPAALDIDSWGFAIPTTINHAVISGFDAEYEHLIGSTDGQPSGRWAAVPVKSDMTLVQKTETNGSFDLDVYYGFNISYGVSPGIYTGTVLYTAVANPDDAYDIENFSISPSITDNLDGGIPIYLTASIAPEFDSSDIGIVNVKIGGQSCAEASGFVQADILHVECSAPALPAGTYDVEVSLIGLDGSDYIIEQGYTVSLDYGSHDISINPTEILIDTPGRINLETSITTAGLTSSDIEVIVGDSPCEVEEISYNEEGHLTLTCSHAAFSEIGTYLVELTVLPYGEVFVGELSVRDKNVLTELSYMQEMTADICANTPTPAPDAYETIDTYYEGTDKVPTRSLTDSRDGNTYTVSKLSDGNCWMTQNLRLGDENERILSDAESDLENEFTLPPAQTSGKSGWNNTAPHVYDTGSNETGALYNWNAATAGSGTDGVVTGSMNQSICPKGWTLPTISGSHSYTGLLAAYSWADRSQVVDTLIVSPFSFVFSGGYYYGYGGTTNGEYWTASPKEDSITDAYYVKLESLSRRVYLSNTKPRSGGAAVRCVARRSINISDTIEQ